MTQYIDHAVRRYSAVGLTTRKHEMLRELAMRSTAARIHFVNAYWDPAWLTILLRAPRTLIEARRRAGDLQQRGLTVHQSEMAFKDALWMLRVSWAKTLKEARWRIYRNPALDERRRHWMFFVLRWPDLLHACLQGEPVRVPREFASGLDERRLSTRLRAIVLSSHDRPPRRSKKLWFSADTLLYRPFARSEDRYFKGAWLALTGIEPRQRICVPLAGHALDEFRRRTARRQSLPTLHVEVGERIVFHLRERIPCEERSGGVEAGIDKGYATLLTLSTGEPRAATAFGSGAHRLIGELADADNARRRQRHRLMALERSMRVTDAAKARRLRRHNSGRKKQTRRTARNRSRLRQQIGEALNELFRAHPDVVVLHVEDLRFRGSKFSRAMRLRFTKWMKGYLHESLTYKAQLHGVRLNVVNAAWTSLTCPRCGYPSRGNRSGERFVCGSCGYAGAADAVAATNILMRGSDRAITRYMRKERVQQILMERWRSAPSGGAWSSNEMADGAVSTSSEQLTTTVVSPSLRSQNYSPSPQ